MSWVSTVAGSPREEVTDPTYCCGAALEQMWTRQQQCLMTWVSAPDHEFVAALNHQIIDRAASKD